MVRIMYLVKTWTGLQSPGILASAKEHVISKDSSQINKRCWSALKRRICLYLQQSLLKNWRFAIKKKLEGKNPIQKAIFFRGEVTGEESKGQMISHLIQKCIQNQQLLLIADFFEESSARKKMFRDYLTFRNWNGPSFKMCYTVRKIVLKL